MRIKTCAHDDLRVMLGVGDKLKGWGSLYRRAVEPALVEVNEFADFSADWEVARQRGRKVLAVRFNVFKKGEREAREMNGRNWKKKSNGELTLKAETYEAARRMANGYDVYLIESDWKAWSQGKPRPRHPDGAFLKFVQRWAKNRQGNLLL